MAKTEVPNHIQADIVAARVHDNAALTRILDYIVKADGTAIKSRVDAVREILNEQ